MKKGNVINLIKYYSEKNDIGFRNEAYEIARYFDSNGDYQLSEYIMALLSDASTFVPQVNEYDFNFFRKEEINSEPLPLPEVIETDVKGIINAISHQAGVNKFLFQGAPGTGKTETAKQIARILDRELFVADFASVVDSKLGQTTKNIVKIFKEINDFPYPHKIVILFDEIDSIALDRTNDNDLREMGRATSTVLRELEKLNEKVLFLATTNLYEHFDKALLRRFDAIIDFNRYSQKELLEIAEVLLEYYLAKFKINGKNIRAFRKIISLMDTIPYPADLKNLIRISIAFSNPKTEFDYLRKLYLSISNNQTDLRVMQAQGFTVREIEILTGISKSQVSRELKGE